MGQPSPSFGPDAAHAWEPVFMQWASGGSSEEGQEGHKATTLTSPPQQLGSSAGELARCHGHPAQS